MSHSTSTTGTRTPTSTPAPTPTPTPAEQRPGIGSTTLAATAFAVAAAGIALAKLGLPVPAGDTETHRFLPFGLALAGIGLTVVAGRATHRLRTSAEAGPDTPQRRSALRWLRGLAATGVATSLHALVVAALSFALTPQGRGLPLAALAWLEDWYFVLADGALIGLLALVPLARRSRAGAVGAAALPAVLVVGALANTVTPRLLATPPDLANPLGIEALAPLAPVGITCFLLGVLGGLLTALVRGGVASFSGDRGRRPAGRRLFGAALLLTVFFVVQGALTGDGAGAVAGLVVAALLPLVVVPAAALGADVAERTATC